jgi:hypothetical protein
MVQSFGGLVQISHREAGKHIGLHGAEAHPLVRWRRWKRGRVIRVCPAQPLDQWQGWKRGRGCLDPQREYYRLFAYAQQPMRAAAWKKLFQAVSVKKIDGYFEEYVPYQKIRDRPRGPD